MNIVKKVEYDNPDIKVGLNSIIGSRQYQQDYVYYYSGSRETLAVICDGMGGMEGGDQASQVAAECLGEAFLSRNPQTSVSDFLSEQAMVINGRVAGLKGKDGSALRAGTTIVAVVIQESRLYWLSIGDSKIYIIRNEEMSQVNREHNYRLTLSEALRSGTISQEQYDMEEKKRQAEALISYLGIGSLSLMDINRVPFEMQEGDVVLLCSDGLYKSLNDSQIKALVRDNDIDMNIAADRLCSMALRSGGGIQDNTSVLLVQYCPGGR